MKLHEKLEKCTDQELGAYVEEFFILDEVGAFPKESKVKELRVEFPSYAMSAVRAEIFYESARRFVAQQNTKSLLFE